MLFASTPADKAILPTAWGGRYFFNRIGQKLLNDLPPSDLTFSLYCLRDSHFEASGDPPSGSRAAAPRASCRVAAIRL